MRHASTKMSDLHFVAAEPYARRLARMGESSWRISVSGAPSLDHLLAYRRLDRTALASAVGIELDGPIVIVTFHSETVRPSEGGRQVAALVAAMSAIDVTYVITSPNTDVGHSTIADAWKMFTAVHRRAVFVPNLGTDAYFSLMRCAAAMVGNSSSGIIEAPSFELPVVNIGQRQHGRLRAANVIDVADDAMSIATGLRKALSAEFRATLTGLVNPYGDGHAGPRIAQRLADAPTGADLLVKRFEDLP